MPKHAKLARLRQDKFYKLAKESGYRSRASFKLIQLNRKYGFLNKARVLVDLCAAPGGWLQVAANILPVSSIIVGVDLVPIKPIHNVITHVADITHDVCLKKIKQELSDWKADVVLHDGAPNLGQDWLSDAFGQAQLTLSAMKLASQILTPGGWFVTKIFRSKDYLSLLELVKKLFKVVHSSKPVASRRESAEIFLVCKDFVGLKNFDQNLLKFNSVFREDQTKSSMTLKKLVNVKKPNRDGYKENGTIGVYSSKTASEFISADDPFEFLSTCSSITLDKDYYLPHTVTSQEIKHFIEDIPVLGVSEVKQLLKWRKTCIALFSVKEQTVQNNDEKNEPEVEMSELQKALIAESQELKSEYKKKRKLEHKQKLTSKKAAKQINSVYEPDVDHQLFSLSSLKNIQEIDDLLVSGDFVDEPEPKKPKIIDYERDYYHQRIDKLSSNTANNLSSNPLLLKETAINNNIPQNDEIDDVAEADLDFMLHKTREKKTDQTKLSSLTVTKESKTLSPEELALGLYMKESNKNKKELLDMNWNRNVRAIDEDLPKFFKEYEEIHRIVNLPITKEEVDAMRQKQIDLSKRPIKKVLEAKRRKSAKKERIIESTKTRAEKILDNTNELDPDKIDQVKSLYQKAKKAVKQRPRKTLVVAKAYKSANKPFGKPKGIKGPVKIVDRRMKKDKRGHSSKRGKKRFKSKARYRKR